MKEPPTHLIHDEPIKERTHIRLLHARHQVRAALHLHMVEPVLRQRAEHLYPLPLPLFRGLPRAAPSTCRSRRSRPRAPRTLRRSRKRIVFHQRASTHPAPT